MDILYDLLINTILLFALVFIVSNTNILTTTKSRRYTILIGFVIGFLTLLIMFYSSEYTDGIIYDTRTVLLSVTGLFFAPLTAVIAGTISLVYRVIIGGVGVYAGSASIISAVVIGILWKKYIYKKLPISLFIELLLFGLVVHIFMFLSQLLLPINQHSDTLLFVITLIVPTFTFATAILSISLIHHNQRVASQELYSRYRQVIEQSPFGIIQYNKEGVIQLANKSAAEIYDIKPKDLIGWDMTKVNDQRIVALVNNSLQGEIGIFEGDYTSMLSGKTVPERTTFSPTIVNGVITGGMVIIEDLSELKETKDTVIHISRHDILTGLLNRQAFENYINNIPDNEYTGTIILLDINGLRVINEVFNYDKGNELLVSIATILNKDLPETSIIARYGGDEFIAYIPGCSDKDITTPLDTLHKDINNLQIEEFDISVSLGIASNKDANISVYTLVSDAESNLFKDKMLQSESLSNAITQSLKTTLFERSDETQLHANRMEELCEQMAKKMSLSKTKTNELKLLAILHDIGKIGISDTILKKPGKLTKREYDAMKLHPSIGYKMANAIPQLESIAYPILTHHEWYDGNGYPKGLQKEEIPLLSRILSIVDAYDAMTNDRIYRKALSKEQAIQELNDYKGSQFDPNLVSIFLTIITKTNE